MSHHPGKPDSLTRTSAVRRPKLDAAIFAQRDGNVRLGSHPERSFVVTPPPDLAPEVLLDLLRRLDGTHSRAHTIWYAGTLGLSANSMSTMLAELDELGLLKEGDDPAGTRVSPTPTVVHLVGRGPIADAFLAGLTSSTTVEVRRSELTSIRLFGFDATTSPRDIAVLTDEMAPDPRLVTDLVRRRIAHLHVRLRDGRGVVGPFVLPGVSSCLRCADLVRCDLDPQWPHVSAQLLGRVGAASKPTVLATAALALGQVEGFTSGRHSPLLDTTVEVDLTDHTMTRRTWVRHPRCDCSQ